MNTILSMSALSNFLNESVPSITFKEGTRAEQFDAMIEHLRSTVESAGGSFEFRTREKRAGMASKNSKDRITGDAIFKTMPDLRKVDIEELRRIASSMKISFTDETKKKDLFSTICSERRNMGLSVPMPSNEKRGKNFTIQGFDLRKDVSEAALRTIAQKAGVDTSSMGRRKIDIILAIADARNISPERVIQAAQKLEAINASNAVKAEPVAPASVSATPVKKVVEPDDFEEMDTVEAVVSAAMASNEMLVDATEDDAEVRAEVETDNPFLRNDSEAVVVKIERQIASASKDLEDLLS